VDSNGVLDGSQSDSKLRTKSMDVMKDSVEVAYLAPFLIFGEEGMFPPKKVEMN
jgi:hypothetical protein